MSSKSPYDILVRPVITERAMALQADHNQYTFEVAVTANKQEIREAIQAAFGVKVTKVTTVTRKGKTVRNPRVRGRTGKRPDVKRAVITLAEGNELVIG